MRNRTNYQPGNNVHWIQARKALEDRDSWEPATLVYGGRGKIAVRTSYPRFFVWFTCKDFLRLLRVVDLDTGVCDEPRHLILVRRWSVAMIAGNGSLPFDEDAKPAPSALRLERAAVTTAVASDPAENLKLFSTAESEPTDDPEILEAIARQERPRLWIIDNRYVSEPSLGGLDLGELPEYDTTGYELIHMSQAEFDKMMEEYYREHGNYPDT
jgi:hypothetical protein